MEIFTNLLTGLGSGPRYDQAHTAALDRFKAGGAQALITDESGACLPQDQIDIGAKVFRDRAGSFPSGADPMSMGASMIAGDMADARFAEMVKAAGCGPQSRDYGSH